MGKGEQAEVTWLAYGHSRISVDATHSPVASYLFPSCWAEFFKAQAPSDPDIVGCLAGGRGGFRGASESTQKIKDDFRWFPSQKAEMQTDVREVGCKGSEATAQGWGTWRFVGPSCSGRKGRVRPPRAVQHKSQRGVRTAFLTLSHNSHRSSREKSSAENSLLPSSFPKLLNLSLLLVPTALGRRCWVAAGQWSRGNILCHWAPATLMIKLGPEASAKCLPVMHGPTMC